MLNLSDTFDWLCYSAEILCQNWYNDWFSKQVSMWIKSWIDPPGIKITWKLSNLKALHASWTVDSYDHLWDDQEMIINGFNHPSVTEVIEEARANLEKMENPSRDANLLC